ncbi:hypothetical protein VCSRO16_2655 [Vibrio cholerae]|nr:hypothetical protein VCSRO16_2655 [Vibrio cholerae]
MKTRLSARSWFFFCLLVLNAIPSWAHETSKNLIIQTSPLSSWNDSLKKNKKDWEIQLKVGGWSHHKYKSDVKVDFNQSHNGLGIALALLRKRIIHFICYFSSGNKPIKALSLGR